MIAKITGTISHKQNLSIIVEVSGIGYEVIITSTAMQKIDEQTRATFFIAEHIKEDEHTLYGFLSLDERNLYYQLTSVNGVGPKAAIAILSTHSVSEINDAITTENTHIFSSVSGIGTKTAQRIILDLRGKLVTETKPVLTKDDQAYQALIALGFSTNDSKAALQNIDPKLDTNSRVKLALKEIKS